MNLHSTLNFLSAISILIAGLFAILKNRKSKINFLFFLLTFAAFIWQAGTGLALSAKNPLFALIATRLAFLGIALIPIFSYHLSLYIAGAKSNKILFLGYICAFLLFIPLSWTPLVLNGVYTYPWGFFFKAGPLHPIFMVFFLSFMVLIFFNLFLSYKRETNSFEKNRKKYFLIALFVAYIGSVDYLPTYGLNVYPFGYLTLISFVLIFAYAIIKYRLMDINVALTRVGVFAIVYILVLGIPLGLTAWGKSWLEGLLGYNWYWAPMILSIILATAGPFIFMHLLRRTEEVVFKERRRYQETINNLSENMIAIRDMEKLLPTISSTVGEAIKIKFAMIYLKQEEYKSFQLKSCYPNELKSQFPELIPLDDPLIAILNQQKKPLLSEEIGQHDKIKLDSGVVIPLFGKSGFLGFIVLGAKRNNQMYTNDDLLMLKPFSYTTGSTIENCIYWHEIEERQRQERLQEMDTYSYSLAHEIDNPMQVILGHATLLKAALSRANLSEAERKELKESLDFILECQHRVSTMVEAIRDFGQKATGEHNPLNIEEVVGSFAQLYSPQFKANSVVFEKTSQLKEPVFVLGEKPELMQVLVILANNAVHAMTGLKEKKVSLNLELAHHDWVRIALSDNGYGIKKENLKIIFKPFVTTKASTEGTGMGLHNALRIIERHKGKIWAESAGESRGATFFIELPIAKDIKPEDLKDKEKSRRVF